MATSRPNEEDVPFPRRGVHCVDFWQVPDLLELTEIRRQVATFDAQVAAVAAEWQAEQRQEPRRRERERRQRNRRI